MMGNRPIKSSNSRTASVEYDQPVSDLRAYPGIWGDDVINRGQRSPSVWPSLVLLTDLQVFPCKLPMEAQVQPLSVLPTV